MGQYSASDITPAPAAPASGALRFSAADIDPPTPVGQQPASLPGIADTMADQAKRAIGAAWEYVNPLSLGHAIVHLPTTLQNAFDYTTDAVGRLQKATSAGDAKQTVLAALGTVPLVGPQAEQIAGEVAAGKIPEAIGHVAGLRALGELVDRVPAAASAVSDTVAAAKKLPIKDIATSPGVIEAGGAAVGGMAGHMTGLPYAGVGGAYIGKQIGKAVSDVVNKAPEVAPADPLLDGLAQGFGYKDFATAGKGASGAAAQQTIRNLAAQQAAKAATPAIVPPVAPAGPAAATTEPPMAAAVPNPQPPAAAPGPAVIAGAPKPIVRVPAVAAGTPGVAMPPGSAIAPEAALSATAGGVQYTLDPESPGRVLVHADMQKLEEAARNVSSAWLTKQYASDAQASGVRSFLKTNQPLNAPEVSFKDGAALVDDGNHRLAVLRGAGQKDVYISVDAANADEARQTVGAASATRAPQVQTISPARPEAPAGAFAAKARAAKVGTLADTLDGVIPPEDVARMSPGDWQRLAKGLGINAPSPTTVSGVIDELKARAAARSPKTPQPTMIEPSAEMKQTLAKPGVLAAAQAMLSEMRNPGAPTPGNPFDALNARALHDAYALPDAQNSLQPITREKWAIVDKAGQPVLDKRGVQRIGAGPFSFTDGTPVPAHLEHLRPPAPWTDELVDPDPAADVVAKGRDTKGRLQSLYSAQHKADAALAKWGAQTDLQNDFPRIEAANEANRASAVPRIADAADALDAIIHTGIRAGGEGGLGDVKAYGMANMEGRHLIVASDGSMSLQFIGKEGIPNNIPVSSPEVQKMLAGRARSAGADGQLFPHVNSDQLNDYVQSIDARFTTRDFRTLVANRIAQREVSNMPVPVGAKAIKAAKAQVGIEVGKQLGHAPGGKGQMALDNYINPAVFAPWD